MRVFVFTYRYIYFECAPTCKDNHAEYVLASYSCNPLPSFLAVVVVAAAAAVLSPLQPLLSHLFLHVVAHEHVCLLLSASLPLVAHSPTTLKDSGRCAATGCESFLLVFLWCGSFTSHIRPFTVKSVQCNKQINPDTMQRAFLKYFC